ncbi:MAG: DNA gyrase inhibitor YacG [Alphaproteobacteria bacterium]|nr:DNA gyrase inhibitor YacG [Alphaproteobacteria bacterium]
MSAERPARPTRCPICGRPAVAEHRPFCSARCRRVDLGRWFSEAYRVPAAESEEEDAEETKKE